MFKIGQTDRFSYPVSVDIPADGGKRTTYTFDAIFRRLSRDEFVDLTTRAQAGETNDAALVRDVLLGLDAAGTRFRRKQTEGSLP